MPIDYQVDHRRRLVFARGIGSVDERDVFAYQREAWSRPDVAGYDELIDMSGARHIEVPSLASIRELAALSAGMDAPGQPSKSAIVAPDSLANALARMYEACRALQEGGTKEIRVFRTSTEALAWLGLDPKDGDNHELPSPS
jgi:hypothetical protein